MQILIMAGSVATTGGDMLLNERRHCKTAHWTVASEMDVTISWKEVEFIIDAA